MVVLSVSVLLSILTVYKGKYLSSEKFQFFRYDVSLINERYGEDDLWLILNRQQEG